MTSARIGVILAGGRSLRFGQDKATCLYQGKSFLSLAKDLLQRLNCETIHILGRPEGIEDERPFSGPGQALSNFLRKADYSKTYIVLSVDMPLLSKVCIDHLLNHALSAYFDQSFFPCIFDRPRPLTENYYRMRDILDYYASESIVCPTEWQGQLANINTQKDYKKICQ
ncbi:NTP transferase domain-containing protein [Temperatibacter marinus]|uniref:NTP transferase domain-containing protein n=1 Tax=Temperatibacter marinus TaxID=1456591 RepID=A0AA52EDC2_9PROT|nr:NTP transferase domain-containing protein [Temperatibacter marinus]WND02686.1 NTP transferase domain-containing protein [Temperatibacter marinus]